jgi:hypothetical protein
MQKLVEYVNSIEARVVQIENGDFDYSNLDP